MQSSANASRLIGARRKSEIGKAIFAGLCFAAAVAFSIFAQTSPPNLSRDVQAMDVESDDDLKTGSVVFVPVMGDECRLRTIDNNTWRMHDKGTMPCHAAFAQSGGAQYKQWSAARVDAIRGGFNGK